MKAPETHNGKRLCYEESFRSRPYPTEADAKWKLKMVREFQSPDKGWLELEAHIEQTADGYIAVRYHALYK